jgi:hypothetical protein
MADTRSLRKSQSKPKGKTQTLEEEYIHNLQQQAYFLELELKLLKDKEREQKSMFPSDGLENGPLSENIIQLKGKYKQLQIDLEKSISTLSEENKSFAVTFLTMQKSLEKVSQERAASEKKFSEFLNYSRGELDRMKKVLNSETSAKDDLLKRITEVCKEKDLSQNWANDLRLKFNKQDLTINKTQQKIAEIEEFKNQIVEEKNRKIAELQADTSKLEAEIKGNKTLTNVLKEIEETVKIIDELSIERDNLTNKVRSLEFSKDLIDKTCAQLNSEKRQLTSQLNELKSEMQKDKAYQETLVAKRLKDLDSKAIKNSVRDLETARKEAAFQQDQFKQKSIENVVLIEERNKLADLFKKESDGFNEQETEFLKLSEHVKGLTAEMQSASFAYGQLNEKFSMMGKERFKVNDEFRKVFKENSELKSQVMYLSKRLEMNDQLKHLNIEDLKTLNRSNLQVNDALEVLMEKWENIQAFQKSQVFK